MNVTELQRHRINMELGGGGGLETTTPAEWWPEGGTGC